MRILVVDDERAVADLVALWCAQDGHDTRVTTSSTKALELVAAEVPDLLITDARMPDMDGLSLVRHVRARFPAVMAIVITGYTDYSLDAVVEAGASDLMLKPMRAPELRARLQLAARARAQIEQLSSKQRALQEQTQEIIQNLKRELAEERSANRANAARRLASQAR